MDLEERTLEDTLEHSCTVCGARLTRQEILESRESGDPHQLAFTSDEVLARVAEHGDLFAPVLELEQPLPRGAG